MIIHTSPEEWKPKAHEASIGVKFSHDIFIAPAKAREWGIEFTEEDLEDGPWGRVLRIKR